MIHEYIYHENRFLICEEKCIVKKRRFINRVVSFLTIFSLIIPNTVQFTVSAEESEKYPYSVFGRNGITMSASSNLCMNGNMHTNKNADISYLNGNINGRITTGNDIEKRVKHVYSDQKIMETYFTENCDLHEEEYVYSDMNIHINNPMFCYNNITLDGNVSLNSNLGSLMNINVTGEVKNANTSVVYSKYGDITIENDSTANINGLIYVPLGTLTINSPNINLNGVIIADKIVINGSSININYKDDIAQFIGNTSEVYDFSGLEYLPEEWLGDTDEDELFDIYEKVIDTDPFDSDTDDDGLPDGYEVITLNTDPLEIDTDENGISDADEDFDSDNLSNLGEYNHGTEPFNPDTDEDGFMDGDEVYTYGTEPLNPDTDNDGLLDGEESYDGSIYTKYGIYFDPLNPDTNGNGILDGDEVFGQSKKQEVETHDEAITEISVDMDTNGNLERNLTIESMYNVDAMSTNVYALIGEPFNFETPTSFSSATITFKIDQTKLGDTLFDNLIILWYNEDEQVFEELPTTRDAVNSTVSTTTTHFSQYMIVDSEKWYANWEASFNELRKMWSANTSYYKALNTILIVDCSWKMRYADEISYSIEVGYNGVTEENYSEIIRAIDSEYNADFYTEKYGRRKCNRAYICENIINNMSNGDHIALIMYGSGIQSNTGLTGSYYPLMSSVQNVNNDGGTMYLSDAVSTALSYVTDDVENTYRIVIVTSGSVTYGSSLSAFDYSNVSLNIVSLGGGSISSAIESIAQSTGGDVYYGYPSSSLTGASGSSVTIPPQFIGEDSDGDGIPDIVELYGLLPNGKPINTNPYLKDTDGDGIPDNEEIHFSLDNLTCDIDKKEYDGSICVWSYPDMNDSDGDGILDNEDESPSYAVTEDELKLKEFVENADFFEIAFLFGGENGENIGFVHTYENIYDRIKVIEILRKHMYTNDYVSYYKDMVSAGYIAEMPEKNWFGNYKRNDAADLMLYSYELASDGISFSELSAIAYQQWSSDMKAFVSIWLFGVSDAYCKQLAKWDYSIGYKISLEQEKRLQSYIEINGVNSKNLGKDRLIVSDDKYLKSDGTIDWEKYAPNAGYVNGTKLTNQVLKSGTVIDRYGKPTGRYASPIGTTYSQRSLPYIENPNAYHKYLVTKDISNVSVGEIAPAFEQVGGGIQYEMPDTISNLMKHGFIKEIP